MAEYEQQLMSGGANFLARSSQRTHLQPLQTVGREKLMQEVIHVVNVADNVSEPL